MTHRHPLETQFVKLYRRFRKRYFTMPKPDGPFVLLDMPPEEVRMILGRRSYAPNWEFSYNKRGEVLNLAQVVYHEDSDYEHIVWWQTHVRGWQNDDGMMELSAHWEPEPTENGAAHLDGVGFDHDRGMDNLRTALEKSAILWRDPVSGVFERIEHCPECDDRTEHSVRIEYQKRGTAPSAMRPVRVATCSVCGTSKEDPK